MKLFISSNDKLMDRSTQQKKKVVWKLSEKERKDIINRRKEEDANQTKISNYKKKQIRELNGLKNFHEAKQEAKKQGMSLHRW